MGPACLPDANTIYTPAMNVTVSGWGKNSYDKTDRNAGTNFVSQLNMASVPVIDRNICKKEEIYGEDKISVGMFCAGLLEVGVAFGLNLLKHFYSPGRHRHLPR